MNELMNELIDVEKSHMIECLHISTISAFLSQANKTYSTLTRQVERIII